RPPRMSAAPTILLIVESVPFPKPLAICTPRSAIGAEPSSIQHARRACTVPSIRCRAAPKDLKTAPCSRSVPTATFASKPKIRIRIGVINEPPPIPVMPTRIPTRRPARANCQVTACGPDPSVAICLDQNLCNLGTRELDRREVPGRKQLAHLRAAQEDVVLGGMRARLRARHRPAGLAPERVLEEHRLDVELVRLELVEDEL